MLYPVLPVFLTGILHASGSVVGLVDGIAQATQNVVQGFSGWLSDRLQRRKPIALAGYLLAALAKPLTGVAIAWPGVLGARVLDRFGAGLRSAPRDALVASSVSAEHRGRAFGLEGLGDNLGAFLGPVLAVVLLATLSIDMRWIFYLAFVPGVLAFVMVLLVRERAVKLAAKSRIDFGLGQFPRRYWKYILATAAFAIGNSSNAFLILQTQSLGASLQTTILIYAGFNLVAALISYPAGALSDRFGRRNLLMGSYVVFFVVYLGFAFAGSLILAAVLFMLYGLYQGIFRAMGKAFASDFVPEHLRASGIGWYSTTVGMLQLVASVVAGLLWDRIGHTAVFAYGAAVAVVGSVALVVLTTSRNSPGPLAIK